MTSTLRLIAATPDMRELLVGALADHEVAFHTQGKMVVLENTVGSGVEHVVSLLRNVLTAPEREAVSVVEELEFPGEFPVTTRLEAWWSVFNTSWFEKAIAADDFSVWFQPVVDTTARRTIGHECLLRLAKGHRRETPEILAAAAARRNLRGFDLWSRELAIHAAAAQRVDTMCFVNFIPSAIYRPEYCMRETMRVLRETGLPPANVVMTAVGSN